MYMVRPKLTYGRMTKVLHSRNLFSSITYYIKYISCLNEILTLFNIACHNEHNFKILKILLKLEKKSWSKCRYSVFPQFAANWLGIIITSYSIFFAEAVSTLSLIICLWFIVVSCENRCAIGSYHFCNCCVFMASYFYTVITESWGVSSLARLIWVFLIMNIFGQPIK